MRLPTYDEIKRDEKQLEVYEFPFNQSLFVAGPPGSGKTVLAVRRAEMLASADVNVVLVTFNRMLRRLIALLTDTRFPVRTMHKLVGDHYWSKAQANAPSNAPFEYDWKAIFETLHSRGVKPGPIHAIVDEGQDLPPCFFRYLPEFAAATITVFADEDQAVTERRSTLLEIKTAAGLDDPVLLASNHRNTPEIAAVAEHFYSGMSPIPETVRPPSGELPVLVTYRATKNAAKRVANWYLARGGTVGVAVARNSTGAAVYGALRKRLEDQRVDIYTSQDQGEDAIQLLDPGITILNVQSIKGQEFDTVFVMELDRLLPCATDAEKRVMYMLCARARDNLFLMHPGGAVPPAVLRELPGAGKLERP